MAATSALGPPVMRRGGDLARMLGVGDDVTEPNEELTLPSGEKELLSPEPFGTYVETAERPGPTVMIIGDSSAKTFLRQWCCSMPAASYGCIIFSAASTGSGSTNSILTKVWWMPTERSILCGVGVTPSGFPSGATVLR